MSWTLAIDFGTTATAAAVFDGDVELIHVDGLARLPSLVLLGSDGAPIVGAAAERQAPGSPERVERAPKRRLGDRVLLLGDGAVDPVDLVAAVLSHVAVEARRRQGGTAPTEVILTHPAAWVGARLAALREAARRAELGEVTLLPEPVAAAVHLADDRIAVGDHVAVYDLGGGTFDAAVLRRTATGFEPVGAPGGDEHLGGEDFDELLYDAVGRVVAARDPDGWQKLQTSDERSWVRANAALRDAVRAAKEALSSTPEYTIYIAQLDTEVRVTREELEDLVRPALERTVDELEATIERAGLRLSEIKAVYLVGGSSRLPLAARLVSERTQLVPLTWGDPKAAVALGAARRSGQSLASPVVLAPATAGVHVVDDAEIVETVPADAATVNGRKRVLVGTAIAVAVALVALVLTVVAGGGDDEVGTKPTDSTTTTAAPGELRHSFPSSDADGVRVARSWLYSSKDGSLQNDVTVTNLVPDAPKTLVIFEVIPKEIAATVAAVTFDPQPTANVQDDPVVRFDLTVEPAGSSSLQWTVTLEGDVDAARLESLAATRDAAEKTFHAEQAALVNSTGGAVVPPVSTTTTTLRGGGGGGGVTTTVKPGGGSGLGGGSVTTTTSPQTVTTSPPTTTAGVAISAPGEVASIIVRDPIGEDISGGIPEKVRVTLQWSAPSDNGGQAPTSYKVRCTMMENSSPYTGSGSPAPCKGGANPANPSGSATSTQVVVERMDPGPWTWLKWEIAAVNSGGTGPYRTAQVVIPNVQGMYTWEAWPLVRGVGLMAGGGEATCGQPSGSICSQSRTAGGIVPSGTDQILYVQP